MPPDCSIFAAVIVFAEIDDVIPAACVCFIVPSTAIPSVAVMEPLDCSMLAAVTPFTLIAPAVCFRSALAVPSAVLTARSLPVILPATVVFVPLNVTSFAEMPLSSEISAAPSTVKSPVIATASLMVTSFAFPFMVRLPLVSAATLPYAKLLESPCISTSPPVTSTVPAMVFFSLDNSIFPPSAENSDFAPEEVTEIAPSAFIMPLDVIFRPSAAATLPSPVTSTPAGAPFS